MERLTRLCMGKTEANSDNCYYINIVEQQQGNKSKNNNSFKYVNLICALPNFCFESETINKFLFKAIINSKTWNEMRYKLVFCCCLFVVLVLMLFVSNIRTIKANEEITYHS